MKMIGLPFAASSTRTTFVVISVRRASVPRYGVSRRARDLVSPSILSTVSRGPTRSPSWRARIVNPSGSCEQSRRIAIASSTPPSQASFFWKTWTTTRGWRPSARSVARAWLKYASVYQPARIFSTGRSKTSGARRFLACGGMLELEARLERRLGHLELLGAGLRGREAVLELMSRLRQRPREKILGVPRHPAEELGCRRNRADLRSRLRALPVLLRREPGEDVGDRGRGDKRADEMPTTALVLLRRALPVLVAADRDVLRTVIGRELARTQRHKRRRERDDRR